MKVNIIKPNIDKDIADELESYRQELLSNNKSLKNTLSSKDSISQDEQEIMKELESYHQELTNEKKRLSSESIKNKHSS